MQTTFAEKNKNRTSIAVTNQNSTVQGKSMPAVPVLQKKEGALADENILQGKFTVQREGGPEEKEPAQLNSITKKNAGYVKEPMQGKFNQFPVTNTIQRMVVFSGANPPEDSNIVATLPDTERSAGGPVVHDSSNPNYGTSNKIALLAHGGQGSIEWKGEDWDGEKLVNDELLASGHEIKGGTTLELWSCSAGEESNTKNDSLVHDVQKELRTKSVNNVTVKGVTGAHLVLNDLGDHYIPKGTVSIDVVLDVFPKLRSYYLWLWGFFSTQIVLDTLGGFKHEVVGTTDGTHPVLFPNNLDKTGELIKNLKALYNAEKKCGGIDSMLDYPTFLEQRMAAWQKMCSFLRTNAAFKAITEKVDAGWFELTS